MSDFPIYNPASDTDRSKVFWLLKKYSSYTVWKDLQDAYIAFADAWWKAMKIADDSDIDEFNQNATKSILDGRIDFEQGMPRLKKGDRSVWRKNSAGALRRASGEIVFINRIMDPEEYVFDWMKNRDVVVEAAQHLKQAFRGKGIVNERDQIGEPAPRGIGTVFDPFWGPFNFPAELPEAPEPSSFTVDTGNLVTVDGIYEPEWGDLPVQKPAGMLGKLRNALTQPSLLAPAPQAGIARRANIGCMNYIIANTIAPTYRDTEAGASWPVTWRLVWKDTRYLDGVIPPEEAEYLAQIQPTEPASDRLRCEAGQPCPREGFWITPAQANSRQHFKQGENMPALRSGYGSTIWQWDENQSS